MGKTRSGDKGKSGRVWDWRGWVLVLAPIAALLVAEYGLHYLSAASCGGWPVPPHYDSSAPDAGELVQLLLLADTHLLGPTGHWFDRARREWQMERAFQSALDVLAPDAAIVLGDATDEGKWTTFRQWEGDVSRFKRIFRHEPGVQLEVVVGNHDVGFHDKISSSRIRRFETEFGDANRLFFVKGQPFVVLNSMAFEDDCMICRSAETALKQISEQLLSPDSSGGSKYRRPILLVHFPMYRSTQEHCASIDITPDLVAKLSEFNGDELQEGILRYRNIPNKDVMSQDATEYIMTTLKPAFVFSGHNHYSCLYQHPNGVRELTVSTFSWRNRADPSFVLATVHATQKRNDKSVETNKYYGDVQSRMEPTRDVENTLARYADENELAKEEDILVPERWKMRGTARQDHLPDDEASWHPNRPEEQGTSQIGRGQDDEDEEELVVEVYFKQCGMTSEVTIIMVYVLSAVVWLASAISLCRGNVRKGGPLRSKGPFWSSQKMSLKMV